MLLVVVLLLRRHLHIQKFAALPMTPRLRIPPLTLPCGCRQGRTLADLDPLASLPRLLRLSLLGNNVTTKKNYRLYTIFKLQGLKHLDFRKIKGKVR